MAKAYADLSSAAIDLDYIRESAQRSLLMALDSRRGRKALVLDPHLGGPLTQICQFSTLRQHNVDRMYYLEGGTLETECTEVVFLVRPRLELMHKLAEVVKSVLDDVEAARKEHVKEYGDSRKSARSTTSSQYKNKSNGAGNDDEDDDGARERASIPILTAYVRSAKRKLLNRGTGAQT